MAHELEAVNGMIEMAYLLGDDVPWHGMGQAIPKHSTLDVWAKNAMPFHIDRSRVRYAVVSDAKVETLIDESHHVLFRNDTKSVIGLVSDKFKIVQPREALEAMSNMAEAVGFHLCTAGTLKGGRKLWVQAEASLEDTVGAGDVIKGRLLIATACDGSMRTMIKDVMTRVVCNNTLSAAYNEKSNEVRVSHRSNLDVEDVKSKMGITSNNFKQFIKDARELAKVNVSSEMTERYIAELLKPDIDMGDVETLDTVKASQGYRKIEALFNGQAKGSDLKGVMGTAWGLVNAITEYVDYHRGTAATTISNRLDYAWFGPGDTLKTTAFSKAMAFAI